jgi:hypothetical protein
MCRFELICSKLCGKFLLGLNFNDLPEDILFFLILLLVFVSRILVSFFWLRSPVLTPRIFTSFVVVPTLGFGEVAHAAGPSPSDCWTGHPYETELRETESNLLQVQKEIDTLAARAVEKASDFGLQLPGSPAEQKIRIAEVIDLDLDGIDLNRRIEQIRRWEKAEEIDSPDSEFWFMITHELAKFL